MFASLKIRCCNITTCKDRQVKEAKKSTQPEALKSRLESILQASRLERNVDVFHFILGVNVVNYFVLGVNVVNFNLIVPSELPL